MRLLAIETSEYVSSLALVADGEVVAEQTFESRMNLCETLAGRIAEMLGEPPRRGRMGDVWGPIRPARWMAGPDGAPNVPHSAPPSGWALVRDIALAVSLGPGSFTGLRVGLATAKALSHACQWPLVGIGTQEAIAAAAEEPVGTLMCVVQHARQGHVYAGLWEKTAGGVQPCSALRVVPIAELPDFLGHSTGVILGPAAAVVLEAAPGLPDHVRLRTVMPSATAVARLAAIRLPQADREAAFSLQPLYVLASQAERTKQLFVTAEPAAGNLPARRAWLVRRAGLGDLVGVMSIENVSFASPWSERSMRDELTRGDSTVYLVAEADGLIAGYVGAWIYAGEAHICNVAVSPELRRSGLAELLVLTLLEVATTVRCGMAMLEYRVGNLPAAGLYEKLGFRVVGRRKRYYQDTGEDAAVASIPDLAAPDRHEALRRLRARWDERHGYDVRLEL